MGNDITSRAPDTHYPPFSHTPPSLHYQRRSEDPGGKPPEMDSGLLGLFPKAAREAKNPPKPGRPQVELGIFSSDGVYYPTFHLNSSFR
jgi:hypothetical protein